MDRFPNTCLWNVHMRFFFLVLLFILTPPLSAEDSLFPHCTRQEDIIYGRKFGTALTMDRFTPHENARGIGIIFVVSGGWSSRHADITEYAVPFIDQLAARGYTVFAVVHGSRPRYSIPEIVSDLERAIRFIRFHAEEYRIDPDLIGICGASAGGQLSLLLASDSKPANPSAEDPVDRCSTRLQAVAVLCPPTDLLNYGRPGENALGKGPLQTFHSVFDFREIDSRGRTITPITDPQQILEVGRKISPVNHITPDDPPTLIIHGDKDSVVPIQQSESIIEKLQAAAIPCRLIVRPGADHGWKDYTPDITEFADWFNTHLPPSLP